MDNYELKPNDNGQPITKQMLWERKLLDFSLRNNLINIRIGKRVLPLKFAPYELENLIRKGEAMQLKAELTALESESDLQTVLKHLYRASRTALEENGANSLFLALGTLKWYETPKNEKERRAPILLLPVEIIRKGGAAGYVVRARDEETILNITLVELLKQQFKIDLTHLNPLPEDESGVDVKAVLDIVSKQVAGQTGWEVMEESLLGLFSFNKFVMWNDIHTHADKLKDSSVISSLMENRITWQDDVPAIDAREMDKQTEPSRFSIPLDVDSSQLEAVVESGAGKSFILHGPPGTGKSQTITNMIANALYRGKRVLFVAEKMAALSVVQKRLARIGLDPFCLELHSNKVTKSHFLAQMQQALDVLHIQSPSEYENTAAQLFEKRNRLTGYMEALHKVQPSGFSLYDCITHYLSMENEEMLVDVRQYPFVSPEWVANVREKLSEVDLVFRIVGKPAEHPLDGLEPLNSTMESTNQLRDCLQAFREQLRIYTAFRLFVSDKPEITELRRSAMDWLETMEIPAGLSSDFIDVDGLSVWNKQWETIRRQWFLLKFFSKRSFLNTFRMEYANAQETVEKTYTELERLAEIHLPKSGLATELPACIDRWLAHTHEIRNWCQWCVCKQELKALGLEKLVDEMVAKGWSGEVASNRFLKGLYHQLALQAVDSDESLRMFNCLLFEEQISKYKQLAAEFQELSKKELYSRLAARIPSLTIEAASSSEMGILKRNIANGGRGTSIRRIIDQIPTLLPKLCPCMLMSPISVAQYIDLEGEKFDLVIFDEASQMPTCEAVGAIARGKALVVVGDPKQMPPTSFFASNQVDEEEAVYDDMESILDDCISLSVPSRYLTWHYRSKHESLITFSNLEYYEGRLHTFPSVDDRLSKVSLVKIEGTYDKGRSRCNRAEAEAIVQEIIRRLKSPELSKYSIGVVSFSQVQQNLIEDILLEKLAKYPELEKKAFQCEEPIFVKNLENVQGDERDVILFSVGYGPDENGHVSMNFGPLNNQGGERRLNVAVSRSRYEMMIFSTLRAEQIDLKRTQAKGVEGLKKFLQFAERGTSVLPSVESAESGNSLVHLIASELSKRGCQVDTQVGRSHFKVDLAILDPKHPNRYLLGILCDGKNHYQTKTARDREIVQPNVLRSLHWNIMRVWSVDWFDHQEEVVERILERLEQLQKGEELPEAKEAPVTSPVAQEEEPVVVEPMESLGQEYVFANLAPVRGEPNLEKCLANPARVKEQVRAIIAVEQPITQTLLCKRIAELWNTRVTSRLHELIDDLTIPYYMDVVSTTESCRVYWENKEKSEGYRGYRTHSKRDIHDIPFVEVMNATRYAVEQQVSIPLADLQKCVAQMLGFSRKGASLEAVILRAVDALKQNGALKENDGMIVVS